jgi:hypothetical protein
LNIGLAFPHKDSNGFNVVLQALPLDGKMSVAKSPMRRSSRNNAAETTLLALVRAGVVDDGRALHLRAHRLDRGEAR